MGKYFLALVVAFMVIIIGMLFYPTTHTMVSAIDVTSFTDLEKAGMVLLSYGLIIFMVYIVYAHIIKR